MLFLELNPIRLIGRVYGASDDSCVFIGTNLAVELELNALSFHNFCLTGRNFEDSIFIPECGHIALLLEVGRIKFDDMLLRLLIGISEKEKCHARRIAEDLFRFLPGIIGNSIRPTVSVGVQLIEPFDNAGAIPLTSLPDSEVKAEKQDAKETLRKTIDELLANK